MRMMFLWNKPNGYMLSGLTSLAGRGHDVVGLFGQQDASIDFAIQKSANPRIVEVPNAPEAEATIQAQIDAHAPDVIFVSGWKNRQFRQVCRKNPNIRRVLCLDTQWLRTFKQRVGVLLSRYLHRFYYDAAFVAGPRSRTFARIFGFADERIVEGLYCAAREFHELTPATGRTRSFLFVGRLVAEKNVPTLLRAYQDYARRTDSPWGLEIVGQGPLRPEVERAAADDPNVIYHGFQQPAAVVELMRTRACFVLPSTFEPWGVVVHEAALCGRAMIVSKACGAVDWFVETDTNGVVLEDVSVASLSAAMREIAHLDERELAAFGEASRRLGARYTPDDWVNRVESIARA